MSCNHPTALEDAFGFDPTSPPPPVAPATVTYDPSFDTSWGDAFESLDTTSTGAPPPAASDRMRDEPARPEEDAPPPTDTAETDAFERWATMLHESAKHEPDVCRAMVASGYAGASSTFVVESGGAVLADTTGADAAAEAICGVLSSVTTSEKPLAWVEHCNGAWRGAFSPFADASANSLGMDASFLQSTPREFHILGHLDASGEFVADHDTTCLGTCSDVPEWSCPATAHM